MKETERKDDAISVKSMQIPTLSTNSPYYTHDESCLLEFSIRRQNLNLNTHKISIDIITSDGDRKNILKEYLSKKKYTTISNQNEFIATSDSVYICLTSGFISNKTFIKIAGDYEEVEKIKEDFLNKYESTENQIYIDWKFLTEEGVRNLNCPLDLDHTPVQEMYPFLNCSLNEYYEKFIQSKSNILILKGPPGTGKTTFIKGLLHFAKTSASFVQDESLLNKDILFVDFFESSRKFLVCEDADIFLTPRCKGNQFVHRFLNVAEGLISNKEKKIILTTNIPSVNDMDQALVRPGRCFDILEFPELNKDQAEALAKKFDLDLNLSDKTFTVAEILNNKKNQKVKSIGFC